MGGFGNGSTYGGVPSQWARWNETGEGKSYKRDKNVSFNNSDFTSYYTVVARYVTSPHGKVALFSWHKFSVSTSSQIRAAWKAANVESFDVPYIGRGGGWNQEPTFEDERAMHRANLAAMWTKAEEAQAQEIRAWKRHMENNSWRPEWTFDRLQVLWELPRKYANAFDMSYVPPISRDTFVKFAEVEIVARIEKFNDPKEVARRERTRARRLAKAAIFGT